MSTISVRAVSAFEPTVPLPHQFCCRSPGCFQGSTIDEFLLREFKAGVTAEQLYAQYQGFGEVPCVFRDDNQTISIAGFNHWQYAKARCGEICGK